MIEIKLYKSRWKAMQTFLYTIPFVVIGVWIIRTDTGSINRIIGLFFSFFFGLGILVGIFHLLDRRPQIIINEFGIWDRTTNIDVINWEVIQEAYPINIYGQKFISLVVDENINTKVKQYKWATKLSEWYGAQKINIHLGQIKIDHIKLAEFINAMTKADLDEKKKLIKESNMG